jgi:hypothetical protein
VIIVVPAELCRTPAALVEFVPPVHVPFTYNVPDVFVLEIPEEFELDPPVQFPLTVMVADDVADVIARHRVVPAVTFAFTTLVALAEIWNPPPATAVVPALVAISTTVMS